MNEITVERLLGDKVAICGLLAQPGVLAALVEARALIDAVADAPAGDPYADAEGDLAEALAHTWIALPARDLAGLAAAVADIEHRTLVGA